MNLLSSFIETIKKAALEAVEASKPVKHLFGEVINISPLQIKVDQKMTLESEQLILTRNVKDYTVEMTVDHLTENTSGGSGYDSFASHNHAYTGRKLFTVHNGLVVGDKVLLSRMQGGQQFVVEEKIT